MVITADEFLDAAVSAGLIEHDAGRGALSDPRGGGVVEKLCLRGRFPSEAIYRAVASQRGLPFADMNVARPSVHLLRRLPPALLRRARITPIEHEDGSLMVATSDPDDRQSLDAVCRVLGRAATVALADPAALKPVISQALADSQEGGPAQANDPVALLESIMADAYLRRASDVHLEPQEHGMRVRVRVDGKLRVVTNLLRDEQRSALISRVKVLSDLDISEQRAPQDGAFTYRPPTHEAAGLDIRVATMPTEWGERATLRLLGTEDQSLTLESLGMEPADLLSFRKAIRAPHGILLLTGPTGSGKTTTLYAALREINQTDLNIMTVEDPVEYRIPGVSQVHVGGTDKVTFASALRALLRHDPDVLMVGEIRDAETADAAMKAAMTGHLVFSTLHTNSACAAVSRLFDIGCEPFRVAATVSGVVAQRLARRLCSRCKQPRPATPEEAEFLGRESADLFQAKGCAACVGTGYRGRIGLFETFWIEADQRALIAEGASDDQLANHAGSRIRTLRDDCVAKVLRGLITVEDAMRVTVLGA